MSRTKTLSGLVLVALVSSAPLAAQRTATQPARKPDVAGFTPEFGTMWTFDAPPLDYWKARYNFTPDQAWLDHVRLASVRLPGCSSSFVSARGLVMTNHHCGRSCTAAVSPKDTNYIETGFAATSMADEKKCPGLYVDQLQSIEDVTARIQQAVTGAGAAQVEQRDAAIAKIQDDCHTSTGLNCQVVTFYQGGMYSLYRYKRFSDVRLVMAPEEAIAFFGGDPDNFTYPRYDIDLTLLRVYENGAPLATKDYLKFSANGPSEGEAVFVTGNPGSTGRLLTVAQMDYLRDTQYPAQLAQFDRLLAAWRERSAADPAAARTYENAIFGIANSKKAVTGYRAGLVDTSIMARKRAFEREFRARITRSPELSAKYGGAWDAIATAERERAAIAARLRYSGFAGGSALLQLAGDIAELPAEAALPDTGRLTRYRGAQLDRVRAGARRGPGAIDVAYEKLILASHFEAARKELSPKDPLLRTLLGGQSPEVAAEALVDKTTLGDAAVRKALIDGGTKAIAASKDPLVALARSLAPTHLREARLDERLQAVISANAELIGQAIFAAYGKSLPPDATFTLRITDGVVKGYPQNGTVAPWKTTMYGLYGRAADFDNKPPFQLPQRWVDGRDRLDLSTPMDFVSTNDIIGGNSGSPVINRNAEIVGLIFDENIECLPNRFIFTDEAARSVSVDSRAIVEALRKIYQVGWIAEELVGS